MNDNYVAMGKLQCPVCLEIHDHNAPILIHKQLRNIKKEQTFCGEGCCEEHDKLREEFIALVVIKNEQAENISQEDAQRTGSLIHLKRTVFNEMFSTQMPKSQIMVFISEELETMLTEKAKNDE